MRRIEFLCAQTMRMDFAAPGLFVGHLSVNIGFCRVGHPGFVGQEHFFRKNQFLPAFGRQFVCFSHHNCFFRTSLNTITAKYAAEHVDVESLGYFFPVLPGGGSRFDRDALGGTSRGAHVACHAFDPVFFILR